MLSFKKYRLEDSHDQREHQYQISQFYQMYSLKPEHEGSFQISKQLTNILQLRPQISSPSPQVLLFKQQDQNWTQQIIRIKREVNIQILSLILATSIIIDQLYISTMKEEPQEPYVGYIKDSDYYFDSYSHFSIHEQMLKDSVRTKAYKNAIMHNENLFKDKIVLDVGSGTGILSIFAAQAGAKHVYGVQKANIYIHSRNIIKENKLQDKITIINGLVQQITLPVEKVDIIISEWMGYFLLYESMFDSVLYARNKWLAPDGILLPDSAAMHIAAIDDGEYYKKKLNFWDNLYGVSMKCIKKWVLSEPLVDPIDQKDILSNDYKFYDINLKTVTKQNLDYLKQFELSIDYDGKVYGFVTWFDCQFSKGDKKITLSTSPYRKSTHWKQTIFYLQNPFQVYKGDEIRGKIKVKKAEDNIRELNVTLTYGVEGKDEELVQYYRIS